MEIISKKAKEYAERVCSGLFPIEYSRHQVVSHTENDFRHGALFLKRAITEILEENLRATESGLVDEDKKRPVQDVVTETYKDLIFIIGTL